MQERIPNIIITDGVNQDTLQDLYAFYDEWTNDKDQISVQTSGSTGASKTVFLDKEKVKASAKATGAFFDFEAGEKVVLCLSTKHIAGKLMVVRALLHNMAIIVLPTARNPLLSLENSGSVKNEIIHFAAFVPYQVEAILENPITRNLYQKIYRVIIGGAPINSGLEKDLLELDNQNFATFGMTETITHFALRNLNHQDATYACLPGFEIEMDERGCLVIKENQITDRLVTNDLIRLIDASHFEWLGRADFVVNSAGYKISPEQIERKIAAKFNNRAYFLFGVPDSKWGQSLILFIEGPTSEEFIFSKEQWISVGLTNYQMPKETYFVRQFDRTATDKIIRKDYRD